MICGHPIWQVILCPLFHWFLSAFMGWLGHLLTLTILYHICGSEAIINDSYIRMCSVLVGLSFALLSHVLEDYYVKLF